MTQNSRIGRGGGGEGVKRRMVKASNYILKGLGNLNSFHNSPKVDPVPSFEVDNFIAKLKLQFLQKQAQAWCKT